MTKIKVIGWFAFFLSVAFCRACAEGEQNTSATAENIIHVYPTDSASEQVNKVQGAAAGDTVLFHPGTYDDAVFYITHSGNAQDGYITFKAFNPNDKPVFDMSRWELFNTASDFPAYSFGLCDWPGGNWGAGEGAVYHDSSPSPTSESWDRGVFVLWRVGYINIEDMEFTDVHSSSLMGTGVMVNAEGGPVNVRRIKVTNSDTGFSQRQTHNDGTALVTVSESEFGWNGKCPDIEPSTEEHSLYLSGGTLILEYCYIHDAIGGQNLHLRSRNATIRYNWVEKPYSYMADMMDIREDDGVEPDEQVHTYIGNVFVDGKSDEVDNHNIFVMMVDGSQPGVAQIFRFYYNTFIGRDTYATDGDYLFTFSINYNPYSYSLYAYNNIFYNVLGQNLVRNPTLPQVETIDIRNNWLHGSSSDYSAFAAWMSDNLFGADPGFNDVANGDYTLAQSSEVIGQANPALGEFPGYEYLHEMEYRIREDVNDLGAYESGGGSNNGTHAGGCSMSVVSSASSLTGFAVFLLVGMLFCKKKMRNR